MLSAGDIEVEKMGEVLDLKEVTVQVTAEGSKVLSHQCDP